MYDYKLLKSLYEVHSPSRGEKTMRKQLRKLCEERGAKVEQDNLGNLFVTKGNARSYPCICAHMDQVQNNHSKDFTVLKIGDTIFAYSPKSKAQQGLGADDKNGLWIALELLQKLRVLKCAFFVGEELGCVGSNACSLDFFKDVRYCIQPDRRNGGDLITSISGSLCSDEFKDALDYERFGYRPCEGLSTDVGTLAHRGVGVSCINISCGYYHPHTDQECTLWSELCNALDFALHICRTLKKVYKHKYELPKVEPRPYRSYFNYDWLSPGMHRNVGFTTVNASPKPTNQLKYYAELNEKRDRLRNKIRHILECEPHLTFEEMSNSYPSVFGNEDVDIMRTLYKDEMEKIKREYLASGIGM